MSAIGDGLAEQYYRAELERLRRAVDWYTSGIAERDAEIERLRAAVQAIVDYRPDADRRFHGDWEIYQHIAAERMRIAIAALADPAPDLTPSSSQNHTAGPLQRPRS